MAESRSRAPGKLLTAGIPRDEAREGARATIESVLDAWQAAP